MTSDLGPTIAAPLGEVATARLELRHFAASDVDELAEVFAKPEVWQFPYGRGFTREETSEFLETQIEQRNTFGFGCWIARTLADGRVVGYVGISVPTFLPEILPAAEVGWRLDPDVWGQGYATEGACAALDEAFATLQLEKVCSLPQADNVASVRVAERLQLALQREVEIAATNRRGAVTGLLYEIDHATWQRARPDLPLPVPID